MSLLRHDHHAQQKPSQHGKLQQSKDLYHFNADSSALASSVVFPFKIPDWLCTAGSDVLAVCRPLADNPTSVQAQYSTVQYDKEPKQLQECAHCMESHEVT